MKRCPIGLPRSITWAARSSLPRGIAPAGRTNRSRAARSHCPPAARETPQARTCASVCRRSKPKPEASGRNRERPALLTSITEARGAESIHQIEYHAAALSVDWCALAWISRTPFFRAFRVGAGFKLIPTHALRQLPASRWRSSTGTSHTARARDYAVAEPCTETEWLELPSRSTCARSSAESPPRGSARPERAKQANVRMQPVEHVTVGRMKVHFTRSPWRSKWPQLLKCRAPGAAS